MHKLQFHHHPVNFYQKRNDLGHYGNHNRHKIKGSFKHKYIALPLLPRNHRSATKRRRRIKKLSCPFFYNIPQRPSFLQDKYVSHFSTGITPHRYPPLRKYFPISSNHRIMNYGAPILVHLLILRYFIWDST